MKIRQRLAAAVTAVLLVCTGCGAGAGQTAAQGSADAEQSFAITRTQAVQTICDRGYLIVGCKDDVPGFGYYNEQTRTYEGGEISLAYYLAAKLFDVSYEEAVSRQLVHFQPLEVTQRESALTDHTVDYVIATYTITDERKQLVDFSDCYYASAIGLMINKSSADDSNLTEASIRSAADLDGKVVGVPRGATTRTDLYTYLQRNDVSVNPQFQEYASYDALSNALENGQIDVFCVDVTILQGYLTSSREILPDRFASQKYGIAAAKDTDGLIDAANTVLDELNYNGIVLFS